MIYNLAKYISTKYATVALCVDSIQPNTPNDTLILRQTGGKPSHFIDRVDYTVQLLSRHTDPTKARLELLTVHNYLKNIFRVQLPAVTVNSVVHPAIMAWQISPLQAPGYLGTDENGRHLYSVNYVVTTN